MFSVIYQFTIKENRQSEFIDAWKQLTQFIYEYEGSLGSRLHKESDDSYIAYASENSAWRNGSLCNK